MSKNSLYLGPCKDDKSVRNTINTNQFICEGVHL